LVRRMVQSDLRFLVAANGPSAKSVRGTHRAGVV
jgi:hypothetical protein